MKYLYIGLLYRKEDEKKILKDSKNGISVAHFKFQKNLIDGFNKNMLNLKILASIPAGSFPKMCRKPIYFPKKISDNYYEIGFLNIPIIKHFMRKQAIRNKIIKDAKKSSELINIILYDSYLPYINVLAKLRKKYNNIRITIILPDLPGNICIDNDDYSKLTSYVLSRRAKKFRKMIVKFDSYVLLTKYMTDILNIKKKPYIIIDGLVDEQCLISKKSYDHKLSKTNIFLYSGELSTKVGIDILLSAFSKIKEKNVELWICGSGSMEHYIKKVSEIDKRIKFYGYVDQDEMCKIEEKINYYINPRQDVYEYTKYSFPSKDLEYLKTGKPVIAYCLKGMSKEYEKYLMIPKDNTPESLADEMRKVMKFDSKYLNNIKEKQIHFLLLNKSNIIQSNKILSFIEANFYENQF